MFTPIKNKKEILKVRKSKKVFGCKYFTMKSCEGKGEVVFGMSTKIGNAVKRNKIKRRIKSFFTHQKLQDINLIIFPKSTSYYVFFKELCEKLEYGSKKLSKAI